MLTARKGTREVIRKAVLGMLRRTACSTAHTDAHNSRLCMATKAKEERYIEAVGRRKTSIARARITPAGAQHRFHK